MRKTNLLRLKPMLSLLLVLLMNVAWATTITVKLRDSDGNTLPDGETATLRWWPKGHFNAGILETADINGDFTIDPIIGDEYTLRMSYNYSGEQRDVVIDGSTIEFNTVTFTAIVKDADGNILSGMGGKYSHRQTTWDVNENTGVFQEILPGTHWVHMVFHTTINVRQNVVVSLASDPHVEVFTTVKLTPKLIDCDGNEIDVAGNTSWRITHGCVGPCAGCTIGNPMELLPNSETGLKIWHYNNCIYQIGNYPPGTGTNTPYYVPTVDSELLITIPGMIETFVWEDVNNNGFYDSGEPGLSGVQVDLEKPNGTWLMTAFTNSNGFASFIDYPWDIPVKIHVYTPAGMKPTKSKGAKTVSDNSDIDKNGLTPAFSGGSCASFIDWIGAGLVYDSSKKTASNSLALGIYPNPTRSYTVISYELESQAEVSVVVYDLLGKQVMVVDEGTKTAGLHSIEWYAETLTPGTYICRFNLGDRVKVERLIISE